MAVAARRHVLDHPNAVNTLVSRAERRRNLVAVTVSLTVAALIHGLTLPLLSVALDRQGVDNTLIGINTAVQYLSVFAVAPFVPQLMQSVGPAWLMLWSILLSAVVIVLLPAFPSIYAWFPLRFLLGIALSFLWIAGEAWVNHSAEEHTRGRAVAVYSMAATGGFAIGPLILTATGTDGWLPFLVAAAVMVLAAMPLLGVLRGALKLEGRATASLPKYVLLAPIAMLVYFVFSVTDGILVTFLPLYGMHSGLVEGNAITLITLMAVGGIVWQLPIGWLADHMNRMILTTICLSVMLLGAASMPLVIAHTPWNAVFMFFFGGGLGAIYTLSLVLLGQKFKGADLGAATTVFGVMFCLGSITGPPIGGLSMEYLGSHGMPISLAIIYLLFLPLPLIAYLRKQTA